MNKMAAMLLSVTTAASLALTGCGNSGDSSSGASGGSSGSAGSLEDYAPVEGKEYKISWAPYISDPISQDGEMVKYYEDKFGVDFDIWNLDHQTIHEVMNLKFAAGEVPDVSLSEGITIQNVKQMAQQGVLYGVDEEVIKEYMPNAYAKAMEVEPNWLEYAKVDGKIYGLPEMRDVYKYRTTVVWRGDWLKNVGIEKTPETLEEFEEAFYKFAKEDPDGNGKNDTYGVSLSGIPAVFGAFGTLTGYGPHEWQDWFWMEKNGELVNGAVQPEVKEALKLLNKWYEDGVLDPEFITGENTGGYWGLSHSFINGRIGYSGQAQYYHWMDTDNGGQNYQEFVKVNPEAAKQLVHGQPPVGPDGESGLYAPNKVTTKIIAFGKNLAEEPDKLGKILQILDETSGSSKENFVTSVFGFEDEMWTMNENNQRVVTPEYENVKDDGRGKFNIDLAVWDINEFSNQWAMEHGYDKGAMRTELLTALPSEAQFRSELLKMRDEAYISIITGDQPVEYFDEFVEKWNGSGGEQLQQEATDWYKSIK